MHNKSMMTRRRTLGLLGTVAVGIGTILAGCPSPSSTGTASGVATTGGKIDIRLGYFPNVTHAPALVGVADGTFSKAVGPDATVTPQVFLNGPREMEAMLAGNLDMAYVGVSPAINAFIKSNGAIKIVSGAASGGAVLVARSDAGIGRMEDLVGKRIGTPQKGGTQDVAARYYITQTLKQKLREAGGTTDVVAADSPELAQAFQRKDLEAAWMQEPWGARLIKEQNAKLILDERTLWPDKRYATTVLVARADFLSQHPDLAEKMIAAHVALVKQIEDNKAKAATQINDEIKKATKRGLPSDVITGSLSRIDFTYEPYQDTLKTQADRAFALGFLGRKSPNLTGLVDLTPLNKALATAGEKPVAEKVARR